MEDMAAMYMQSRYDHMLTHILLLLVQQLQGAPVGVRAAFLHSPAGNEVLRVLSEMSSSETMARGLVVLYQNSSAQGAAPPAQDQQQQQPAEPSIHQCELSGHALLPLLLLPGLLLEPAPQAGPAQSGSSSSSHMHAQHASSAASSGGPKGDSRPSITTATSSNVASSSSSGTITREGAPASHTCPEPSPLGCKDLVMTCTQGGWSAQLPRMMRTWRYSANCT
jgi:hypothetical protein